MPVSPFSLSPPVSKGTKFSPPFSKKDVDKDLSPFPQTISFFFSPVSTYFHIVAIETFTPPEVLRVRTVAKNFLPFLLFYPRGMRVRGAIRTQKCPSPQHKSKELSPFPSLVSRPSKRREIFPYFPLCGTVSSPPPIALQWSASFLQKIPPVHPDPPPLKILDTGCTSFLCALGRRPPLLTPTL